MHFIRRFVRVLRALVWAVTFVLLAAALTADAQVPIAQPGQPDLVSDPPVIRLTKDVVGLDGVVRRVMAFEGFLHNVGDGMLEVSGNPQITNGVKQRVFDGEEWVAVGSPTVRFETDDGHAHFHLIGVVDYQLWDDARTEQIGPASKIGFCLVDTEQVENRFESFYELERFDYCSVDDPETTDLRMGITPGWRDTYYATTTLQWVDISAVAPGRYWVSAVTDPGDEIIESDESNNSMVFSFNRFSVPGYKARGLALQSASEPIELKSDPYGGVGDVAYVIAQRPSHGRLDVSLGVDLFDPLVRYVPDAGFVGIDEFSYYAHDVTAMFPLDPQTVVVQVEVQADDSTGTGVVNEAVIPKLTEWPSTIELTTFRSTNALFDFVLAPGQRFFAAGLPPGLRIDPDSGEVTGTPTTPGSFESDIVIATKDGELRRQPVEWRVVTDPEFRPPLFAINDISLSIDDEVQFEVGFGAPDSTYEAVGFPPGTTVAVDRPTLIGVSEEVGDFDVTIRRLIDGSIVDQVTFVWTIRPRATPSFVL